MPKFKRPLFDFYLGDSRICLGRETKLVGVLNVTPDSFSDGGMFLDPGAAESRALRMQAEGAHLIDIGGESSRPGARPVPAKEEMRRIQPVLRRLSKSVQIPISVDTYKENVACMALDEGALLVNDIRALKGNRRLAKRIARYKAGVILMHMLGTPRTMQKNPSYQNLLRDIKIYLKKAAQFALEAGISKSSIVVDPGFGFGKTTEQNFEILTGMDSFQALGYPVLAGLSRKSFLGNSLGLAVHERLEASLVAGAVAIERGAHFLRVHDVAAHKQMTRLVDRTLF